jgi:hypothetical protein
MHAVFKHQGQSRRETRVLSEIGNNYRLLSLPNPAARMGIQCPFFSALNIGRNITLDYIILNGIAFRSMKGQPDEVERNDLRKSLCQIL